MDDQAVISDEVLARYAADAAADVAFVSLHGSKPVVASVDDDGIRLTTHIELEWGRSAHELTMLQSHVRDYVERMTDASVAAVDVVVERFGPPPAATP